MERMQTHHENEWKYLENCWKNKINLYQEEEYMNFLLSKKKQDQDVKLLFNQNVKYFGEDFIYFDGFMYPENLKHQEIGNQ